MMLWRFRRLIAAYGADAARWPAVQRPAAEALLARSAKARALLAAARQLDGWLAADTKPPVDARFVNRIIAHALSHAQERPPAVPARTIMHWPLPHLWPQAIGLATAAVLGFVVGWTDLLPAAPSLVDVSDLIGTDGFEEPLP